MTGNMSPLIAVDATIGSRLGPPVTVERDAQSGLREHAAIVTVISHRHGFLFGNSHGFHESFGDSSLAVMAYLYLADRGPVMAIEVQLVANISADRVLF